MNLTQSEIDLDLGAVTLSCIPEEVALVFAGLLREMRAAAPFIRSDERDALRHIMSRTGGTLTVEEVFPDFERDSEAHTSLRKLRTAQFIRPAGRDMWDRGERIDIRPFARLVWDRLGEGTIFGDVPEAAPEPEEGDIDLSLPAVNEPAAELAHDQEPNVKWDEADVLDFLNDDTKG